MSVDRQPISTRQWKEVQAPWTSRSDFKSCNKFWRAMRLTWIVVRYTADRRNGWWRREPWKPRVSSQTETKVERRMGFSGTGCRRSREKETEHRVAGRRVLALAVGSWCSDGDRGSDEVQTSGCMCQVHTSSRPRAIQRLSRLGFLTRSFPPLLTFLPLAIAPRSSPPLSSLRVASQIRDDV